MSSSGANPTDCVEPSGGACVPKNRGRQYLYEFDDLFREFFPRIVALTSTVTRDSTRAEDVAQETLFRLHARAPSLDFREPIWPWLKTVAMRLAIDHVRKDSRETATEPHLVGGRTNTSGANDRYWCDDGPQLILALNRLPVRQRLAITLRYLKDKDPSDSATVLGLSKRAFEQLLFRGRRNLLAAGV